MLPKYPYTSVSLSLSYNEKGIYFYFYAPVWHLALKNLPYCSVCAHSLSHVQLFGTPWPVGCQAPLSIEFFNVHSCGKNTTMSCNVLLQRPTLDQTQVSGIFCIDRWILYHCTTWEAQLYYNLNTIKIQILTSLCLPSSVFLELLYNLTSHVCEHALVETAATVRVKSNSLGNTEKKQKSRNLLVPSMTSYWKNLWLICWNRRNVICKVLDLALQNNIDRSVIFQLRSSYIAHQALDSRKIYAKLCIWNFRLI